MIDERLSGKIKVLSAIALFVVVLQHSSAAVESVSVYGRIWRNVIAYGIADYPVSFFFLLSGFFLAQKINRGWYEKALVKRLRTLVVPYLLWCMIGWGVFGGFRSGRFLDVIGITHHLPVLASLWYVKILLILFLFSPLFVTVIRFGQVLSRTRFVIWCAIYAIAAALCLFFNVPAQKTAVFSTLYFCLGILIGANPATFMTCSEISKFVLPGVMLGVMLLKLLGVYLWNVPETFLRWFMVPICIYATWTMYDVFDGKFNLSRRARGNGVFAKIFSGTFFMYCAQDLIMKFFIVGIPSLQLHGLGYPTSVAMSFCLAMLVSVCAVVVLLLGRFLCPWLYRILSGGRA